MLLKRFYGVRLTPCCWLRATEAAAKRRVAAALKSIVVPLDGSELAEKVLPSVLEMAKKCILELVLLRAFNVPYSAYPARYEDHIPIGISCVGGIEMKRARIWIERPQELKKSGSQ